MGMGKGTRKRTMEFRNSRKGGRGNGGKGTMGREKGGQKSGITQNGVTTIIFIRQSNLS